MRRKKNNANGWPKNVGQYGIVRKHHGSLSGRNLQKVIIERWLLMDPDILILMNPRGESTEAKSEIYKIMNDLAKQGMAIIMVSSKCRRYSA